MIQTGLSHWRHRFALDVPPSSGVREGLQWLMLARLGVVYFILSIIVLHQVLGSGPAAPASLIGAYGLLVIAFAFNLVQAVLLDRLPQRWGLALANIAFDSVLISLWIGFTDGRDSLFALLYLIQILFAALTFYRRGAWSAAVVASVCFAAAGLGEGDIGGMMTWGGYTALFLTLGLIGGYLSQELLNTTENLKEESLKIERLQEFHEKIISQLPTGLMTVDGEMRISLINPAGEHILGREAEELLGRRLEEVEPGLLPFFSKIDAEDIAEEEPGEQESDLDADTTLSAVASHLRRSFFVHPKSEISTRLQQCVEIGRGARSRLIRGDVAVLGNFTPLGALGKEGGGGEAARVLLFQDVTKLLHLEEKVRQHEKMAAVGQLAAGIAHEIRNPLASVSASIEMLKGDGKFGTNSEEHRLMDIAIREIDRLNNLISEFLNFVKPTQMRFQPLALSKVLGEVVGAVERSREMQGKTIRAVGTDGVIALGSEEKLKQVVWNLVVNAAQAMESGGTIEVGCNRINDHTVKFWVTDTGPGMSEEVQQRLFEPFFTTKEKGTGLGLATAYKIVEAHHGEIRVQSAAGEGTTFEVYLQNAENS